MSTGRRGGTTRGRAHVATRSSRTIKSKHSTSGGRVALPSDDLASRLRGVQKTLVGELESRLTLLNLLAGIHASSDPEPIADALLERVSAWLPAAAWSVVAPDVQGHLAILVERQLPAALRQSALEIARWVIEQNAPFMTADLDADTRIAVAGSVAALALPLVSRGRPLGAIVGMDRTRSSRPPELAPAVVDALQVLLGPAAVSLDMATRLRRVEALSVTDDLTNLYNSRFLNQALHREAKRAVRGGRPLSLLFLDLDGFKSVNDAHGHLLGSRALVETAAVIRSCSRESDIVARFGGDEFAVVLPDTNASGARSVAQRVRERIAAFRFLVAEGLDVRLTVSIGIATLPDAAASSDELIEAADAAMYRVKDRGKNGIEAAIRPADT